MRKDMHKVLTEDPRKGGFKFGEYRNCKKNAVFDDEFSGGKESMMKVRRNAAGERKSFGDHLSPVERFIHSRVGQKWDDVYSEICKTYDKRSWMNYHLHIHVLRDFVELNAVMHEGKVCVLNRWDGYAPIEESYRRGDVYVHPETGVLCKIQRKKSTYWADIKANRAREKSEIFREHDRDHHLFLEDGVWYVYKLVDTPAPRLVYEKPLNMLYATWRALTDKERAKEGNATWVTDWGDVATPKAGNAFCPRGRHYATKQTASRKILRQHGLVGSTVT